MHPQSLIPSEWEWPFDVYLYGLCMATGIIACFGFLYFTMWRKKFNDASTDAIIFIGIFGTAFGIFSAMLFQATYNYIEAISKYGKATFDLGGSMTFIGGLIGGTVSFVAVWNLYMFVVRPRTKIKSLKVEMNAGLTDALPFIPIAITIAHAFGRFGCFWAGCCYGAPTDAWYGLPCAGYHSGNYIPTQLFEMLFLIILGVLMAILYFKFKFNYNFALYAVAYGIWRFLIEYVRADDRGELIPGLSLTPSQVFSIVMVVLGIGYIFLQYFVLSKFMKHPELSDAEQPEKNRAEQNA